ncbi:hypothetical protein VTL71DRAFT_751, partial [Oculimacula yallundae]
MTLALLAFGGNYCGRGRSSRFTFRPSKRRHGTTTAVDYSHTRNLPCYLDITLGSDSMRSTGKYPDCPIADIPSSRSGVVYESLFLAWVLRIAMLVIKP